MEKTAKFSNFAKLALVALVGSLLVSATPAQASPLIGDARVTAASNSTEKLSYIVVFQDGTDVDLEASRVRGLGGEVGFKYKNVFRGLSVKLNSSQLNALAKNPRVRMIEADGVVTTSGSQTDATWGIDRIDQTALLPLEGKYDYTPDGTGVTAYVIDTGIYSGHSEFDGRIRAGIDYVLDGNGTEDCNGHGTHVAGTIGGTKYGVAKKVNLVPVRVLDCGGSGSWSAVISGINWVVGVATPLKSVANLSLGGGASSSIDLAIKNLSSARVSVVVAAGNSNANACNYSPAREPSAITVAASTLVKNSSNIVTGEARASYSNFGSCVDVIAPGSSITSSWPGSSTNTNTISGTSMASPHVAGAVALLLQDGAGKTPAEAELAIWNAATRNAFSSLPLGTPNLLLRTNLSVIPSYPTAPTFTVGSLTKSSASIAWTRVNLTNYILDVSQTPDFSSFVRYSPSASPFTVGSLRSRTTYYFRMASITGAGQSRWSTTVMATTTR